LLELANIPTPKAALDTHRFVQTAPVTTKSDIERDTVTPSKLDEAWQRSKSKGACPMLHSKGARCKFCKSVGKGRTSTAKG
jgi:hypothetical protein